MSWWIPACRRNLKSNYTPLSGQPYLQGNKKLGHLMFRTWEWSSKRCFGAAVPIHLAARDLYVIVPTTSFHCTQFAVGLLPTRPQVPFIPAWHCASLYPTGPTTHYYYIASTSQTHSTLAASLLAQPIFFLVFLSWHSGEV